MDPALGLGARARTSSKESDAPGNGQNEPDMIENLRLSVRKSLEVPSANARPSSPRSSLSRADSKNHSMPFIINADTSPEDINILVILRSINNHLQSISEIPQQMATLQETVAELRGSVSAPQSEMPSPVHRLPNRNLTSSSSASSTKFAALNLLRNAYQGPLLGGRRPSLDRGDSQDLGDMSPSSPSVRRRRPSTCSQASSKRSPPIPDASPAGGAQRPRRPSVGSVYSAASNPFGIILPNLVENHSTVLPATCSESSEPKDENEETDSMRRWSLAADADMDAFVKKKAHSHLSLKTARRCTLLLYPRSYLCAAWDAVMLLATLTIGFWMPLVLAYFAQDSAFGYESFSFFSIVDFLLFVDILVKFNTAYISVDGAVVTSRKKIAVRYLRSWFALDLLTIPPLALPWGPTSLKILCVAKLVRILQAERITADIQRNFSHLRLTALKIVTALVLITHITCCGWRATQLAESKTTRFYGTAAWWEQYIGDFQWVIATQTGAGMTDNLPKVAPTRVYTSFAMVVGGLTFAFLVACIATALKSVIDDENNKQLTAMMRFMRCRQIGSELQCRVEANLRQHLHAEANMALKPDIFARLSPSMQRELSIELLQGVITNFPLFANAPYGFIAELAMAFKWVHAVAGDVVVEEGLLASEIVFVVQGRLVIAPDEEELGVGSWFGERALFDNEHVHEYTACAALDSELAALPIDEYHRVLAKHPRLVSKMEELRKSIGDGDLELDDLQYSRPNDTFSIDTFSQAFA